MAKKYFLRVTWVLPASLGLGALLSAVSRGTWWIGWLAFSLLLILGLLALEALWRQAGAGRMLGLILLLAFLLRLGVGVGLTTGLPVFGHPSEVDQAGYVFRDAFNRDTQAWQLAKSSDPVWKAFDKTYSKDQYGGMLMLSTLVYRGLSPDTHRPLLIILLAALTSAIGVALAWMAARRVWGKKIANPTAWIMALYPESILVGSSQMREPFLIALVAMFAWGLVSLQEDRRRSGWAWMGSSLAGMLLISPGIVFFTLAGMGVWAWLRSQSRRIPWRALLISAGVVAVALVLLLIGLRSGNSIEYHYTYLTILQTWLSQTANWSTYVQQQNSGWIQGVFAILPAWLHLPFMTGYGLTQPLLPAAIFDPAPWIWQTIGILRSTGWYLLAPFLAVALVPILKTEDRTERRAWIWLWVITWIWIVISAYRAGGDQWNNPRYRAWFLLWQALLVAKTLGWWRETRNSWMTRVLVVEGIFLAFFSFWYSSRYGNWTRMSIHPVYIIAAVVAASLLFLGGSWLWDRVRKKRT